MIDLWLAAGGYLRGPDGRLRYLADLDHIAASMREADLSVRWGATKGHAAISFYRLGEIVLAPRLFDASAELVISCLLHEAGHCMLISPSCRRARRWQDVMYGDDDIEAA